jgi:hypothetical protein
MSFGQYVFWSICVLVDLSFGQNVFWSKCVLVEMLVGQMSFGRSVVWSAKWGTGGQFMHRERKYDSL